MGANSVGYDPVNYTDPTGFQNDPPPPQPQSGAETADCSAGSTRPECNKGVSVPLPVVAAVIGTAAQGYAIYKACEAWCDDILKAGKGLGDAIAGLFGYFAHRDRSSRHDDRWFRSIAITRGPEGSERSDAGVVSQSLVAFSFRREGPFRCNLWHRWSTRSQIASASVGSPMYSCHAWGGSCPAMMTEPVS